MGRLMDVVTPDWPRPRCSRWDSWPLPGGVATTALAKSAGCPPPPVTIAKLVHLDVPGHRCYGSRVLVFRAFVAPPCDECGGVSATVIAPRWLDGLEGSSVNLSAEAEGPQVAAYVPPDLGRCHLTNDSACPFHPYREQWATVTARYDDPVAQTCHYSDKPAGGGFTKADAVAECRAKLVVLSVGPDSNPATDAAALLRPIPAASRPCPNGSSSSPSPQCSSWSAVQRPDGGSTRRLTKRPSGHGPRTHAATSTAPGLCHDLAIRDARVTA